MNPDYSFLRIFGCLCFPCLRQYTKSKLSPHSKSCIFLGYSKIHNSYKCFDPSSGKFYVSRHIDFDEHVFPFTAKDDATVPNTSTHR